MADSGENRRGPRAGVAPTVMTWRTKVAVLVVMALGAGGWFGLAEPAGSTVVSGTIATVSTRVSPMGLPLAALAEGRYRGHDSAGALYLELGTAFGIAKSTLGGTLSPVATISASAGDDVGPDGTVVANLFSELVRVNVDGTTTRIAGTGTAGFSGDNGPALSAQVAIRDLAFGPDGSMFLATYSPGVFGSFGFRSDGRIRKIAPGGTITTVAGTGTFGNAGDAGPALSAQLETYKLSVDGSGRVVFTQAIGTRFGLRRIESDNTVTARYTPAAGFSVDHFAAAPDGSVFFSESDGAGPTNVVRRIDPAGTVTTVAGTGTAGFSGDGDLAAAATLRFIQGLDVLPDGSVVVATSDDAGVSILRRFTVGGNISTIFGRGAVPLQPTIPSLAIAGADRLVTPPFMGAAAGGPATTLDPQGTSVMARKPSGAVDLYQISGTGVSFIVEQAELSAAGVRSAFAASAIVPLAPAYAPDGTMYYFDNGSGTGNDCRIRFRTTGGTLGVLAGGECGPGQPIERTGDLTVAPNGTVYNAISTGVLKISASGEVTRVAGKTTGCTGLDTGDGAAALDACFAFPRSITTDASGSLYVATSLRVRKIDLGGKVTTIAGRESGGPFINTGDGGPAINADLAFPADLAFDARGNLYIATIDAIRRIEVLGSQAPEATQQPLVPGRIMDTRNPGGQTVDDVSEAIGKRAAGSTTELVVAGRADVPAAATAAVLNVTVTDAQGEGFITVWPCGVDRPNASNLNFVKGSTIPNAVITKIGTGGKVCFYTDAIVDLIVDVNGQYPAGTAYAPLVPARLLDSRNPGGQTVDDVSEAIGKRAAGSTTELLVAGRGSVPADAAAAVLNVTVTNAAAEGFITVWPCGVDRPNASNVNYVKDSTIPNAVITKIGTGGKVCFYTDAEVDLIVDVNGQYPAGTAYAPLVPARLLDSRNPGGQTVDDVSEAIGKRAADSTTELVVTGRGNVPIGATAAVLNVTVTDAQAEGFITVWPCGVDRPNASNLNFVKGSTIPNAVITKIGTGGKVCFYTDAIVDLIVDVNGYVG